MATADSDMTGHESVACHSSVRLSLRHSIAVDGTSLTIVGRNADSFSVAIIPFTFDNTTFGERSEGARVNLEIDVTAKYVANLIAPYRAGL